MLNVAFFIVMLNVNRLSVVILNVAMLNVVMLSFVAPMKVAVAANALAY
jgi:hypothetical protein